MTPDEAIAHAQSETIRADRERARRMLAEDNWRLAEERRAETIRAYANQAITFDGDTYYAPKLIALALAIGWFFAEVREVMRPMRLAAERDVNDLHRLLRGLGIMDADGAIVLDEGMNAETHRRAINAWREYADDIRVELAVASVCELLAAWGRHLEVSRPCPDCARWAATIKRRDEQIAEIRRVIG